MRRGAGVRTGFVHFPVAAFFVKLVMEVHKRLWVAAAVEYNVGLGLIALHVNFFQVHDHFGTGQAGPTGQMLLNSPPDGCIHIGFVRRAPSQNDSNNY